MSWTERGYCLPATASATAGSAAAGDACAGQSAATACLLLLLLLPVLLLQEMRELDRAQLLPACCCYCRFCCCGDA